MRNSDEFKIPISRFTCISRFSQFEYQRLWNDICHNNQDLSIEIPKKTFKEIKKKEIFKSVSIICNNQRCRECN